MRSARLGEQVDKDMIAVRIGPDFRMAVVSAPSYFESRPRPRTPQDLTEHACINLRLPTSGGLYVWEFRKGARELKVRVQGRAVFNAVDMIRDAAMQGLGLASLPEDLVETAIQKGRLVRVRGLVSAATRLSPSARAWRKSRSSPGT